MWEIQNVLHAPATISLPWHEKDHDDNGEEDHDDEVGENTADKDVDGTNHCGNSDDADSEKKSSPYMVHLNICYTVLVIMMTITMAMVMMGTLVMVAGLMMNGVEIEKTADDFTEAEMKPSNMQNMSAEPALRMLNTMIMTRLIRMTTMMINGQCHHL